MQTCPIKTCNQSDGSSPMQCTCLVNLRDTNFLPFLPSLAGFCACGLLKLLLLLLDCRMRLTTSRTTRQIFLLFNARKGKLRYFLQVAAGLRRKCFFYWAKRCRWFLAPGLTTCCIIECMSEIV